MPTSRRVAVALFLSLLASNAANSDPLTTTARLAPKIWRVAQKLLFECRTCKQVSTIKNGINGINTTFFESVNEDNASAQDSALLQQISINMDHYLPYLGRCTKEERIQILLAVAEYKKVITPIRKLQIHRALLNNKMTEDALVALVMSQPGTN